MAGWLDRFLERRFLDALGSWQLGQLGVRLPDGSQALYGEPDDQPPAELHIHDSRFFRRVALAADVGAGESYMDGEWSSPDLPRLVAAYIRNQGAVELTGPVNLPARILDGLRHLARRNSVRGSERNIHAHYDLGNDFFRLFLDETLTYSCALFPSEESSLREGQLHKYQVVCSKLRLEPRDRLLEIGTGWGSFAIHAAREARCHVTTITVSEEQYRYARERVQREGLDHRVDVQYCDYRHMDGAYDKVVSIEMLEAVGARYWDTFFEKLDEVLAPDGLAFLQVISVPDQRFERYRRSRDWIQKYIFPGGRLPSLYELQRSMRRATRLEIHSSDDIGVHYARTLRLWRERFWKSIGAVRALGFDDVFVRMWDFYLGLCEATFSTHWNRDLQLLLTRPNNPLLAERPG
jgi:cyclopropane-fatty-acyl-phospholipid synthase